MSPQDVPENLPVPAAQPSRADLEAFEDLMFQVLEAWGLPTDNIIVAAKQRETLGWGAGCGERSDASAWYFGPSVCRIARGTGRKFPFLQVTDAKTVATALFSYSYRPGGA